MRTVTLDALRTESAVVSALASQPGGVDVVDESGTLRFHLSIPCEPLDACEDCSALRMENHHLRKLVDFTENNVRYLNEIVADVTKQYDEYARAMDGLAKQVADSGDLRHKRDSERRLAILANLAPHLASVTPGHGPEREAFLNALAEVAEFAEKPAQVQAMRAAYGEWEARRAK